MFPHRVIVNPQPSVILIVFCTNQGVLCHRAQDCPLPKISFSMLLAAEATGESGEESSCEDDVQIPIKQKPLQAHHSLLCDLDGSASKSISNPSLKRQKRDSNMVGPLIVT